MNKTDTRHVALSVDMVRNTTEAERELILAILRSTEPVRS